MNSLRELYALVFILDPAPQPICPSTSREETKWRVSTRKTPWPREDACTPLTRRDRGSPSGTRDLHSRGHKGPARCSSVLIQEVPPPPPKKSISRGVGRSGGIAGKQQLPPLSAQSERPIVAQRPDFPTLARSVRFLHAPCHFVFISRKLR